MKNLLFLIPVGALLLQGCQDKSDTNTRLEPEVVAINSEFTLDSSAVTKCMDEVDLAAFKNVQRTECYVKEVARLEKVLELTFNEVIQKSPPDSRQFLQDAEEAWAYSRDTWCNYVGALPLAPLPLFNRQYCLAEETSKHIEQLIQAKEELINIAY